MLADRLLYTEGPKPLLTAFTAWIPSALSTAVVPRADRRYHIGHVSGGLMEDHLLRHNTLHQECRYRSDPAEGAADPEETDWGQGQDR